MHYISIIYIYMLYEYTYLKAESFQPILLCLAGLKANCFEWDYEDRKFWDLDLTLLDSKRKHISLMPSLFASVWCLIFSVGRNLLLQSLDNWLSVQMYIGCKFFERERRIE